jgi:hypothetical protein
MPDENIGGYEPLMASNSTVASTPDIMTVVGGYSYMTTEEMTLDLGAFSPYQMMQDINGVLRLSLPETTRDLGAGTALASC